MPEDRKKQLCVIEVKLTATIIANDFKGLKRLSEITGVDGVTSACFLNRCRAVEAHYLIIIFGRMTEMDWMRLLGGLRERRPWAYTELYRAHAREVYFFVRRLVGDEGTAEDVTSESFVRTFQKSDGFSDGSGFRAFLFTVARNASIDVLRFRARKEMHEQATPDEAALVSDQDIERQLITAEFITLLAREIEQLPPHVRDVVRLSILQDKSVSEIAEETGVPLKTVKNNKTKGLQLLRAKLLKSHLLPLSFLLLQPWFATSS